MLIITVTIDQKTEVYILSLKKPISNGGPCEWNRKVSRPCINTSSRIPYFGDSEINNTKMMINFRALTLGTYGRDEDNGRE